MKKYYEHFKIEDETKTIFVKSSWSGLIDYKLNELFPSGNAMIYPMNVIEWYWSKFLFNIKNIWRTK